jgi:hypothetical protein
MRAVARVLTSAFVFLACAGLCPAAEVEMLDGSVLRGRIVMETAAAIEVAASAPGRGTATLTVPKSKIHAVRDGGQVRVLNERPGAGPDRAGPSRTSSAGPEPQAPEERTGAVRQSPVAREPAPGAGAQEPVFWNLDGSGSFPDASPPAPFDGDRGAGVRWKAPLPNWSNSSPLVVRSAGGPRVLLLSEPADYAPLLLCLDAETGAELWRVELDAVAQLPAGEQAPARGLAKKMWALARLRKRLTAELQALYVKDRAGFSGREVPAAAESVVRRAREAGFEYRGISQSAGGYPNHLSVPLGGVHKQDQQRLRDLGLTTSQWDYQGTWDGVAYPTPVSDGARVWTVTMHNLYSCHDLDGRLVWQVRFAPPKLSDLTPEQQKEVAGADGKTRWPGGWPGQGGFNTSPIMTDGRLVSCAGRMVRCIDAASGKLLWAHPMRGEIGQALGVPAFVAVGQERYVIGVGNEGAGTPESAIYRLRDGAVVARLPGVTSSKGGVSGPVAWGDFVVNRPGHEDAMLVCHRLAPKDGGITLQEVWKLARSDRREESISLFRPASRDGRLYNGGSVLDLKDGKWVAARRSPLNGGYYGGGGILIGPAFLSWDFYGGTKSSDKTTEPGRARFAWHDARTGQPMGEGFLPVNPEDGKPLQFKREQACRDSWRWLGAATPFAWRDRLYVRAYDFLWCLGPKQKGPPCEAP